MGSGFYGFRLNGEVKAISILFGAEPTALGRRVLTYASEMNPAVTRPLVERLKMFDADERVGRDADYFPNMNPRDLWEHVFSTRFTSLSSPLSLGAAPDATVYGDAAFGYLIDFDDSSGVVLEVYRRPRLGQQVDPAKQVCDCEKVVSYWLNHLPTLDQFLEAINESGR